MIWKLVDTQVIGCNRALNAKVPFAQARVVLQEQLENGEKQYLLVYGYPSPEQAEGSLMSEEEWKDLIGKREADMLGERFGAQDNGVLWLLGSEFPEKDIVVQDLCAAKALYNKIEISNGDLIVCYVNADSAEDVRQRWAERASVEAWKKDEDQVNEAVRHAERALAIGGMSPERVALLAFLYESQGNEKRSKGILQVALNSRGKSFYEETKEKFAGFHKVEPPPAIHERAQQEFAIALELTRQKKYSEALPHAETAWALDRSPSFIALLLLILEQIPGLEGQRGAYLKMLHTWWNEEFITKVLEKYRDFTTVNEGPKARKYAFLIAGLALILLSGLVVLGWINAPSKFDFPINETDHSGGGMDTILRKLIATILVYCMQFGFIAFEAGYVRDTYRRSSAVKNLIVFAISFLSYFLLGWQIQHHIHPAPLKTLLDIAFNAGFASTVALIIANTITERGTLLINALLSVAAAGIGYPLLAGLLFAGGPWAELWGFQDTAGGCVVHVLGGAFGLAAVLCIGPRSWRRAWHLLGRVQSTERKHQLPFAVIGAFFLWFGWLGFNSGNAETWNQFQLAFTNTSIGASAGGLVGLMIAVANIAMLTTTARIDLSSKGTIQDILPEIANIERVVLGMMGGLVAVTANAGLVQPHEALLEAIIGAIITIVGSAYLAQTKTWIFRRIDDPLGAIATHGLAGIVGVLATAAFGHGTWWAQLRGCGVAIVIGGSLAGGVCGILWLVEHRRSGAPFLYGRIFRLTPYEQFSGGTGTEFQVRTESLGRARARVSTAPPGLGSKGDEKWIEAVGVLALSDRPDDDLRKMFDAVEDLLKTSYQGSPEEVAAIAAIRARGTVSKLLLCVDRVFAHRSGRPDADVEVVEWTKLSFLYKETLIIALFELAESFAAQYRVLRVMKPPTEIRDMIEGFVKAYGLLKEIGEQDDDKKLRRRAHRSYLYMNRLPWLEEILDEFKRIPPTTVVTPSRGATTEEKQHEPRQAAGNVDRGNW